MPQPVPAPWVVLGAFVCAFFVGTTGAAHAQDGDRIWGEVVTVDGDRYEGFLRWDRNEGSWVDILHGFKESSEEAYEAWLELTRAGERPTRTIELHGYRITWNEEDPEFPSNASSGVRFGHIRTLEVTGPDAVQVTLKSGQRFELSGGASDIGWGMREFLVEDRSRGSTELDWDEIQTVRLSAVPSGARAESPRLYGTVQDGSGRHFTGYVAWDLDEILESDVLNGEDADDNSREIAFGDIRTIAPVDRGVSVTLTSGEILRLTGSNDVNRRNRGIQISDPALGLVEVEWEDFRSLDLHALPSAADYRFFDGGRRLVGTVITQAGDSIHGRIRWDADEEWTWELLDGRSDGVTFTIEFGHIAGIARGEAFGAAVTLTDGRRFELSESNDVDWDNKGIFVLPSSTDRSSDSDGTRWRYVSWDDFREITFDVPADPTAGGGR